MILTGAGISVPVGIPAMRDLYSNFLKTSKSGITDREKRTCRLLTDQLQVNPDLEDFLVALNAMCEFEDTSLSLLVEKSLAPLGSINKLESYRKNLEIQIDRINEVRERILEYCTTVCFEFEREKSVQLFQGLINAVAQKGYPVFTTNYDFAFEHVAGNSEVDIENNFVAVGRGVAQRWIWRDEIEFAIGNFLTLVKLHGSVTWYRNQAGQVESIQFDTGKNPDGQDVTRQIVFPTRFKDIYDQHFFALYTYFLSVLASTEVLIIIGHSLRDDYLRSGIVNEYRKGRLNIIVVDPEFPSSLKELLGGGSPSRVERLSHIPCAIEDIADELASSIVSNSPLELSGDLRKVWRFKERRYKKLEIKGRSRTLVRGDSMSISVAVKGFLFPDEKPAFLRVWLESNCSVGGGVSVSSFLERESTCFDIGSSGAIDCEFTLDIDVPDFAEWGDRSKVLLKAGLVQSSVVSPDLMESSELILCGSRQFTYTSE